MCNIYSRIMKPCTYCRAYQPQAAFGGLPWSWALGSIPNQISYLFSYTGPFIADTVQWVCRQDREGLTTDLCAVEAIHSCCSRTG